MRLYILHKTHYRYPSPVRESFNELRLHPLTNDWQRCESCFVSVLPTAQMRQYLDLNGNIVHHFDIPNDHSKLLIESRSTVVTQKRVDFDNFPSILLMVLFSTNRKIISMSPHLLKPYNIL